jgi:large subunit ribosomal protein L35Ae
MKAKALNFRRGRHTQKTNQLLLSVRDVESRAAASKLIGRRVFWKTGSGKVISGKVASTHGNNGVVRARFSRGISPEVLGKELEVQD